MSGTRLPAVCCLPRGAPVGLHANKALEPIEAAYMLGVCCNLYMDKAYTRICAREKHYTHAESCR